MNEKIFSYDLLLPFHKTPDTMYIYCIAVVAQWLSTRLLRLNFLCGNRAVIGSNPIDGADSHNLISHTGPVA